MVPTHIINVDNAIFGRLEKPKLLSEADGGGKAKAVTTWLPGGLLWSLSEDVGSLKTDGEPISISQGDSVFQDFGSSVVTCFKTGGSGQAIQASEVETYTPGYS
jgi:hypothetical protein